MFDWVGGLDWSPASLKRVALFLFGAGLVLWLGGRWLVGRSTVKLRPGWLHLVVGLRGHGKTLFVSRLMYERIKAGVPVYANFTVEGAHKIESWRDAILAPRGAMVVLDEASGWAGARAGVTLRVIATWYISRIRHLGHECWVICQHENQLAGAVRDQVNEVVECQRKGGRHRARSFAPHEFRKKDAKPLWTWWYSPRGKVCAIYDTEDLEPPEASGKNTHDDDMREIRECIEIVKARGRGVERELEGWLQAAGVGINEDAPTIPHRRLLVRKNAAGPQSVDLRDEDYGPASCDANGTTAY